MTLKHQYHSSTGQHRIVELDGADFLKESAEWTGYRGIASFVKRGITYIAVTEYYRGTALEPDIIYQLHKTEFKSEGKGQ